MMSENSESDEFLLELTPGDDCIFSDCEDEQEQEHPPQDKIIEPSEHKNDDDWIESNEVTYSENLEEDTVELQNISDNCFVTGFKQFLFYFVFAFIVIICSEVEMIFSLKIREGGDLTHLRRSGLLALI